MKGWLDNYNDSKTTAPEGFQGDGYSPIGRNYSPAWGGQFKHGGEIMNVASLKDPIAKNGKVIIDEMGQWEHPGEITEISGDTMATHGYGDIPLYVVPDKGKPRLVQPNTGTQKFPGAKKFTEYPMAKDGLRQEQKSLQNIDNLVNFTNYNTKQPGGWLDNL